MKSQDHKPANQDKAKVKPGIKASPQVTHPILQLQQLVGNKAVTNMIQRHEASHVRLDVDLEDMVVGSAMVRYERARSGLGRHQHRKPIGLEGR